MEPCVPHVTSFFARAPSSFLFCGVRLATPTNTSLYAKDLANAPPPLELFRTCFVLRNALRFTTAARDISVSGDSTAPLADSPGLPPRVLAPALTPDVPAFQTRPFRGLDGSTLPPSNSTRPNWVFAKLGLKPPLKLGLKPSLYQTRFKLGFKSKN